MSTWKKEIENPNSHENIKITELLRDKDLIWLWEPGEGVRECEKGERERETENEGDEREIERMGGQREKEREK